MNFWFSGVIHCAAERRPDVAEKVGLFTPPPFSSVLRVEVEIDDYVASRILKELALQVSTANSK